MNCDLLPWEMAIQKYQSNTWTKKSTKCHKMLYLGIQIYLVAHKCHQVTMLHSVSYKANRHAWPYRATQDPTVYSTPLVCAREKRSNFKTSRFFGSVESFLYFLSSISTMQQIFPLVRLVVLKLRFVPIGWSMAFTYYFLNRGIYLIFQ